MITKIGFVALVLISCGTLFLLDYYLTQDQEENTKQLHSFVQQTHDMAKAKTFAKEKFEMQLTTDLAHCHENALRTYKSYILLIQKAAPVKHGEPFIPQEILDDATTLFANEKAACKKTHDSRLQDGI